MASDCVITAEDDAKEDDVSGEEEEEEEEEVRGDLFASLSLTMLGTLVHKGLCEEEDDDEAILPRLSLLTLFLITTAPACLRSLVMTFQNLFIKIKKIIRTNITQN